MKKAVTFVLGVAFAGLALAEASDHITVVDPYIRLGPPNVLALGAFMTLKNDSDKVIRLVKASNPVSRVTELHTHINENGIMKMRAISSVSIAAKDKAVLEPGGLHVMMIDLQTPLREGDVIPLTLSFDDGSEKLIKAKVIRPVARQAQMGRH